MECIVKGTVLIIPEETKNIGTQAFWGLDGIEELAIPGSVVKIGKHALCSCPNLSLTIIGEESNIPSGWDRGFAANVRNVYFTKKYRFYFNLRFRQRRLSLCLSDFLFDQQIARLHLTK